MELTVEQKRAMALANARKRAETNSSGGQYTPPSSLELGQERSIPEYMKDIAVGGATQGMELLGTLGGYFDVGGSGVSGQERAQRTQQEMQAIQQAVGADIQSPERLLGAEGAAMAKAPFDPITYLGAPVKGAAGAMNIIQSMFGAGGSEAMSDFGATGQFIGGVGGASFAGAVPNLYKGGKTAFQQAGRIPEILGNLSDKNTQDFLEGILAVDPKFKDKMGSSQDMLETVAQFARDGNIEQFKTASPFFYEALTNPAGKNFFIQAAKNDPSMAALLNKELDNIEALRKVAPQKFGYEGELPSSALETPFEKSLTNRINEQDAKIKGIVANFERRVGMNSQEFGEKLQNAIKVKRSQAEAKLSKRYESLKTVSNVSVGKDKINELITGYSPEDQKEMFQSLSPLMRKTIQGLMNKESLNAEDVIDLKAAINKALRTTQDTFQLGEVKEFADRFEQMRQSLPKGFNQRLRKVDEQYKADVAIPFINDATVSKASVADFTSDVMKQVVTKPESYDSLVEALGRSQADQFVRKGIYSSAYNAAFDPATGNLNPAKLKSFVFKNREVIRKVGGLEDQLKKDVNDINSFSKEVENIQIERDKFVNSFANGYFSNVTGGRINLPKAVSSMFGSQGKFNVDQIAADLDKRMLPEDAAIVKAAMRQEMLTQLMQKGGSLSEQISNNKEAFKFVFDDGYESMTKLVRFFDESKNIQNILNKAGSLKQETDAVMRATGVPMTYLFSQLRDRISSVPQKVARIGTKAYQAGIAERTAKAINDFLTSEESVKKVNEILNRQIDGKLPFDDFAKELGAVLKAHMVQSNLIGAKESIRDRGNEEIDLDSLLIK